MDKDKDDEDAIFTLKLREYIISHVKYTSSSVHRERTLKTFLNINYYVSRPKNKRGAQKIDGRTNDSVLSRKMRLPDWDFIFWVFRDEGVSS